MKGSRFSEEQIIAIVRVQEAGGRTEEGCRRHGISSRHFTSGSRSTAVWKSRMRGG
jgi:Transposase